MPPSSARRLLLLLLLVVLGSLGAVTVAHAQSDVPAECDSDACGEGGEGGGVQAPQVDPKNFTNATYKVVLSQGQPFACGSPKTKYGPDVDCRIEAKITVPAKAARYLGLSSRVLAEGVASNRKDHFEVDGDDMGRTYFLEFPSAIKAKLKAKRVRALGVQITGTITVNGADQIFCDDPKGPKDTHPSCPIDYGNKANILSGEDGAMLCWTVMPWWVAIPSPGWGKMCPKPITAH